VSAPPAVAIPEPGPAGRNAVDVAPASTRNQGPAVTPGGDTSVERGERSEVLRHERRVRAERNDGEELADLGHAHRPRLQTRQRAGERKDALEPDECGGLVEPFKVVIARWVGAADDEERNLAQADRLRGVDRALLDAEACRSSPTVEMNAGVLAEGK
jgi:hypothetical protein